MYESILGTLNEKRMRTISILVALFAVVLPARTATLTLQQGAGGYLACTDSYIVGTPYGHEQGSNFGEANSLLVSTDLYTPG